VLLLGESIACFRFDALAREPSVMRRGSSNGVHGHLPASCLHCVSLYKSCKMGSCYIDLLACTQRT